MNAPTGVRFAVIIPAYNEAGTIKPLVEKVLQHTVNVFVVDDGSADDTLAQLQGLPVTVLVNETNQGKAASLWRGMQAALETGVDAVITMDGDGQHNPDDIPQLLSAAHQYPQCLIIAARLLNREHAPKARLFANNFADFWISWAAGQWVSDSQSGYRLYPAGLIRAVDIPRTRYRSFVFESEMAIEAARHGYPCVPVAIKSVYLHGGRSSHFRPVADITRIVLMVAWKILQKGLYPLGLWRALFGKRLQAGSL